VRDHDGGHVRACARSSWLRIAQPTLFADAPPPLPEHENPATDVPRKFDAKDPVAGRRSADLGGSGVGTTSVAAGFYAKHQSMILAIDHALQLYVPQHDFEYPKTHEEFMRDVVALALNTEELPELPPGEEYIYVPEQAEIGLQIRLTPGSPKSKLPPPEPGKEHIYDPAAVAAVMGAPAGGAPAAGAEPAAEPPVDPRSRAEALGAEHDSAVEEHGLAPGGLAPVGGLE
jgi:hypothetical protein